MSKFIEAPGRRTGGVRGGGSPPATTFHHYLGTENPLCWDTTRPDFFQEKSFSEFSLPPFSKLTLKLTIILILILILHTPTFCGIPIISSSSTPAASTSTRRGTASPCRASPCRPSQCHVLFRQIQQP